MSFGFGPLRCALKIVALAATASLTVAAMAIADTYPVAACNDAADNGTDGWTYGRTAPADQFERVLACPSGTPDPYGSLRNGLGVADNVNAWDEGAPDGSYAEWRFSAPAGTAIVAASITRDIGNRDEWTPYGRIDGVDQSGESCMRGMNQSFCRIQGTRVFSGLNASTIAYGVRCVVAPYCAHGATLRTVWALVLGATVTLDDRERPVVGGVEGVGVADGRWWNRVGGVSFFAQDNTGVRRRRVVVDGVVREAVDAPGAAAGGCGDVGLGVAYSFTRPCADARGLNGARTVTVDPCRWGDGVHSVRGSAVDTGGLEASSGAAATARVDCTAPALSIEPPEGQVVEGDLVEPRVAASDAVSGLGSTVVEVSVDGAAWQPHGSPRTAVAGATYAFRGRAVDAAGNWSGWAVTAPVRAAAAPPQPPPEPPAPPGGEQPEGGTSGAPADRGPLPPASPVELLAEPAPEEAIEATPAAAPAQQQPAAEPAATPLADPRLRITRVLTRPGAGAGRERGGRRRGGVVVVHGTVARTLAGRVTVVVHARGATVKRHAVARGGRWRARIPARTAGRPTAITATTAATPAFAPGAARWRAPRANAAAPLAQHPGK
jgi:hypothetical protein